MKILIAGSGKVGMTLTRALSVEGYDITLLDTLQSALDSSIENYDVMTFRGNAASMQTLIDVGVEEADLLIAATGEDEINLLSCMTAHFLNPAIHTITRIKNYEYTGQVNRMRSIFALSMTVNPDKSAAYEIFRLLRYPGFLKRDYFAKSGVEIVELKIPDGSALDGLALSKMNHVIRCHVLVCTVLRDGSAIIPSGDFTLRSGDRIFVTASTDDLSILLKNLGIITHQAREVLIAGGGRLSLYLTQFLLSSGISVRIIEKELDKCKELSEALPGASVVLGNASSVQTLEKEGLGGCDAFISMTGIDETNIIMSMYASSRNVPQVITKISRTENLPILDKLQLGSIISPKELAGNKIVRYVRAMQNQVGAALTMHTIADEQAEAIEFVVDSNTEHRGIPLKDINTKKNVLIACIVRKGIIVYPRGDTTLEEGDSIVVVSSRSNLIRQLNDIFDEV